MYVTEVPNRNSPPAILLRESFRQDGKVKNRTLLNISSWPAPRIAALRRLLRGELDGDPASEPTCGPVFGLLHALNQVASDLGITAALGHTRLGKLALFLVLARVAHQGSRLSAVRWGVAGRIVWAWVLTIPAAAALGMGMQYLLSLFGIR